MLSAVLALSALGALHVGLLASPRVFFAMARDGLLPSNFGRTDAITRAPTAAIVGYAFIASANDSDFGLYDYVFSGDSGRALRAGQRLRAGNVGINTVQRHHEACFGGTKYSGVGRDGGSFGLYAYTELQSMVWSR